MQREYQKTSANLFRFNVTNAAKQLVGTNPRRIGLIMPVPTGANTYQISFNKGFTSSLAFNQQASGVNEIWWAKDFGEIMQLDIWIKGNGSFTVEFTEIVEGYE